MKIMELENYIEQNENIVIAIEGPSGSGKSTLGKYLKEKYDVLLFHTDDYFLPPTRKTTERLNTPGGNLDFERMEEEIFNNLNNDLISSHQFNCVTNELVHREPFNKKSIIVVEGVYSMHPNFQKHYTYSVFLDIDKETQYKRILQRSNKEMLNRFVKEWIPLEDNYFDVFLIRKVVDLTVSNY